MMACAGTGAPPVQLSSNSVGLLNAVEISIEYVGNPTPITGAFILIDELRVFSTPP